MHKRFVVLCSLLSLLLFQASLSRADQTNPAPTKDWTLLVYLNGDNNLDSFGTVNIDQMEKVGSTDNINIVVQWASEAAGKTVRLLVKKVNETNVVTSPIVQDMGKVDMGDFHSLTDFIEWGAKTYPAKHYFVDVWDHGSGWHAVRGQIHMQDISWDDNSGNHITTQQLAQSLETASQAIGQKIDLYGSDACLMAMGEVADEMSDAVGIFVGSQEVEPGAGWPYTELLTRWSALSSASAQDVAKILVEEYVKSYSAGSNGTSDVTFSAFDLSQMDAMTTAIQGMGTKIAALGTADKTKALTAAKASQAFESSDYVDLLDFLTQMESANITGFDREAFADVRQAASQFVIANADTTLYAKAKGLSIWLPTDPQMFQTYQTAYRGMKFNAATHWADALAALLK